VLNIDPADFGWVLSVNVVGVWATCRSFGRRMSATSEPGWFLVAGSEHSLGVPHLGQGAYTASKHAVLGMCDVMRRELPSHLGVSVMFPGLVATNLWLAPTRAPHAATSVDADDDFTRAVQARGMDPRVLAVRALAGVAAERFIIATHGHVLDLAAARWHEIEDAFAAAALDAGDQVYAVESVAAEVMAERRRVGS
jgi:NAD(P)-dependent dehydrogenase (short-subunit alcohol dehydrogenase family)